MILLRSRQEKDKGWNHPKGRRKQIWNRKSQKQDTRGVTTNNKFNALENGENKVDKEDGQGNQNKS